MDMVTTTAGEAGLLGVILAAAGSFALIGLALYVLLIVAQWKIFTKAGEPGWKSLIPIYNVYTQVKFTWSGKAFWQMLAFSVLSGVCESVASSFGEEQAFLALIFGLAALVFSVIFLVMSIRATHKLSKSFGHGAGFTVGLLFLPNIFMLILGFGSDQYLGPQ